jgi:hypothetical protein
MVSVDVLHQFYININPLNLSLSAISCMLIANIQHQTP